MELNAESLLKDIESSKNVLVLLNEHIPLPLALWLPILVTTLKKVQKEVTVFVTKEVRGWSAQVDKYFPLDMVLKLEALTQTIKIPISGDSLNFGEVSYEVVDKNLEITVVPQSGALTFEGLKYLNTGTKFDLVIGIGVDTKHELIDKVNLSKSVTAGAKLHVVGTYDQTETFATSAQHLKEPSIINEGIGRYLVHCVKEFDKKNMLPNTKLALANLMVFLYTLQYFPTKVDSIHKDVYELLSKYSNSEFDFDTAAKIFTNSAQNTEVIQQTLAQNMSIYNEGEIVKYELSKSNLALLNVNVDEAIVAMYGFQQISNAKYTVFIVEEDNGSLNVVVTGRNIGIRKVAMKYGFSMTDETTCGIVQNLSVAEITEQIIGIVSDGVVEKMSVETEPITEPSTPIPPANTENDDDSTGVDFAEIARKMREGS